MVTETVVKEALSKELIDAGTKLTKLLDENDFVATAAFWFFVVESEAWRFIVATPEVDKSGTRSAYKKVQDIISGNSDGNKTIHLKDISLVSPTNSLISLLKHAVRTGEEISGIRFSRNLINGVLIEDAYIYRLT